jgi:hypothetical protein
MGGGGRRGRGGCKEGIDKEEEEDRMGWLPEKEDM